MSHKLLIKICGISDAKIAEQTAQLGADYIGLIFHPASLRNINIQQAKLLSAVIKKNNSIPVAVFVDQTAVEMQEICLATNINAIQLHGDISRQQHYLLPESYTRIYVISLDPRRHCEDKVRSNPDIDTGLLPLRFALSRNDAEVEKGLIHCTPDRDFLLFDHIDAGQGKSFDWAKFMPPTDYRFFLAGGLNSDNIHLSIQQLKPNGVDVSSGVENVSGHKDIELIQQFIKEARR